jgi:tRNA 2-thiouridine synthesizing protein B
MLHIIKTRSAIVAALGYIGHGDKVILIEDAVYSAMDSTFVTKIGYQSVYVLQSDLYARGVNELIDKSFQSVDYIGFVSLTEQCDNCMTWA